ncbi:MAG TPA: glycine cleavage system aminomethyltransferase GcvT [Chloroflexota bacterium]|nr:glycine cleavage system aminomethyltransferase GcvT [Chloroflexota bacterium]
MSDSPLLRTALFEEHVAAGARLVEFGGWEMPVQYQGIIAEHLIVRSGVGLFDLSHMGRLRFRGSNALECVQYLTTNDVARLSSGRAQYSLCCADDGGVLDDVVVYRLDAEILMVVNASNRQKILDRIAQLSEPQSRDVSIEDSTLTTAMIGVQGPQAESYLQPICDIDLSAIRYYAGVDGKVDGAPAFVARTGYTGEDGFELIVAAEQAAPLWRRLQATRNGVSPAPCGLGARDTLRLEAGMALYGHELNERTTPYEAGLGRVVKLGTGQFAGQAALQVLSEKPPERWLVGFELISQGVPRQGYEVLENGANIGTVTSGTMSPSLHRPIGLAYVANDRDRAVGSEIQIEIRGRPVPARIAAVPFYAHRTKRG